MHHEECRIRPSFSGPQLRDTKSVPLFLTASEAPAKKALLLWNVLGQQYSSFLEKHQLSGRARRGEEGKIGKRGRVGNKV